MVASSLSKKKDEGLKDFVVANPAATLANGVSRGGTLAFADVYLGASRGSTEDHAARLGKSVVGLSITDPTGQQRSAEVYDSNVNYVPYTAQ